MTEHIYRHLTDGLDDADRAGFDADLADRPGERAKRQRAAVLARMRR